MSNKGNKSTSKGNKSTSNLSIAQEKENTNAISTLQDQINQLNSTVEKLTLRLAICESKSAVQERVNDELLQEIDRLEQYGRRNQLIIKGIPLPPKQHENNNDLKDKVEDIITNDLQLPKEIMADFDKTHRIGPVFTKTNAVSGKSLKHQDVIVRMKSHATRYEIYNKRKNNKNKFIKLAPALTNR